jgi:hypothetical protein
LKQRRKAGHIYSTTISGRLQATLPNISKNLAKTTNTLVYSTAASDRKEERLKLSPSDGRGFEGESQEGISKLGRVVVCL